MNTKTDISLKVVVQVFTFRLPGGDFAPLLLVSYVNCYDILFLHTVSCLYSSATIQELVA